MLYAKELPPLGGDTLFANQYTAFENLSAPLRDVLEKLRGVNAAGKKRVASTRSERLKDSAESFSRSLRVEATRFLPAALTPRSFSRTSRSGADKFSNAVY